MEYVVNIAVLKYRHTNHTSRMLVQHFCGPFSFHKDAEAKNKEIGEERETKSKMLNSLFFLFIFSVFKKAQ